MTILRAIRFLMTLAAALVIAWAFVDVGSRWVGQWSDGADGQVTLTVLHWGNPEETRIVAELLSAFERSHPDITVERQHANNYDAKLKTMLAGGTPPDLFYLKDTAVADFADLGVVAELGPHLPPRFTDKFYPVLVDAFRWNEQTREVGSGALYGIPKDFTTMVMYINTDLFGQAGVAVPYDGWTWGQYRDAMAKITALGDPSDPVGRIHGGVLKTWPMVLRNLVWSFGGAFFGGPEGGDFDDVALDEPAALEALGMIRTLRFEDHSVHNATGLSQSEDALFVQGRVGSIGPLGRWMTPTFREIEHFDWDVVPVPHKAGVGPTSAIATVAWAMAGESEHPEAAAALLRFLCGREGQRMTAELGLAMPAMPSVARSPVFLAPGRPPEHSAIFLEMIEHGRVGLMPRNNEFERILSRQMQATLRLNEKTPAEAAAAVERQWQWLRASPLETRDYPAMPWGWVLSVTALVLTLGAGITLWLARRHRQGVIGRREQRAGLAFISPWMLGFVFFVAGPMLLSLLLAVTKWSAMSPLSGAQFVGLDNFAALFSHDADFRQSLWVTIYYTLLAVPLLQGLAVLVALLMNVTARGMGWFRTAYFVPSVVTGVALVTLWIKIFENETGILNALLAPIVGLFGAAPPDWFGANSEWFAVPALVIMTLWGVGGGMIIYLAGLKTIPDSLYEAARIDGAGAVRQFFAVTLPMLSPIVFFQLIMGIIASFQVFTQAYVIRGSTSAGGQNKDLLFYVLYLYDHAFVYHNMGYASAMAWVLFLLLLGLTLILFKTSKSWVHYEGLKA